MEDETSKAQEVAPTTTRAKPELVTIGTRQIISSGRWNDELIADYVMLNGKDRWITIGELAKVAWGQNTLSTKARARTYLSRLFKHILLRHGMLIVVESAEPKHHFRAQAIKVYNPESEQERQCLSAKLHKMERSRELTAEWYERALGILQQITPAA